MAHPRLQSRKPRDKKGKKTTGPVNLVNESKEKDRDRKKDIKVNE